MADAAPLFYFPRRRVVSSTPAMTSTVPPAWNIDTCSPRRYHASAMVLTGPMELMMELRLAPMRFIPSDIRNAGITVEKKAMIAVSW